ncbi:hypothetical protein CK203_052462 [Vitis vinifera]|uniref:Uncharacterized protein n=1 Tax=Vitis vinifera TaxID=29760 RepID=A0A438HCA2_VITVI|nr:hypothetical protein CK203_052462 [Vitis vinifera]
MTALPLHDCMALVYVGRTSIPLPPTLLVSVIPFIPVLTIASHSGGAQHTDVDWSPIIEDLYSPKLGFSDAPTPLIVHSSLLLSVESLRGLTQGNPLGCRGSACMEVMTTLHGSASSLRRRAEGCVPLEGMIASARDLLKSTLIILEAPRSYHHFFHTYHIFVLSLGLPYWIRVEGKLVRFSERPGDGQLAEQTAVVQDETLHDSLPPPPPPLVSIVPEDPPYVLHGHFELRVSDGLAVWDDLEDFGSLVLALYDIEDAISRGLWTNSSPSDVKGEEPLPGTEGTERPPVSYLATRQPCYAAQFAARPTSSHPKPRAQQTSTPFVLRT